MAKILKPGQTGTVFIESIDCTSVVTRDLSDEERSKQAILDYADAYRADEKLPPVQVFLVDGRMILVDGDHRIKGRIVAGKDSVVAECVGSGTMVEALLYALTKTNKGVGLRLSPADCKRRVFLALESGAYDMVPAGTIAKELGIAVHTVTRYSEEWHAEREAEGKRGLSETVKDAKGREQPRKKKRATKEEMAGRMHAHTSPPAAAAPEPASSEVEKEEPPATATPMPGYGRDLTLIATMLADVRRAIPKDRVPNHLVQSLEEAIKRAEGVAKFAVPETCPACGGPGCDRCFGHGWVTRAEAEGIRAGAKRLGKELRA